MLNFRVCGHSASRSGASGRESAGPAGNVDAGGGAHDAWHVVTEAHAGSGRKSMSAGARGVRSLAAGSARLVDRLVDGGSSSDASNSDGALSLRLACEWHYTRAGGTEGSLKGFGSAHSVLSVTDDPDAHLAPLREARGVLDAMRSRMEAQDG